MDDEDYQRYVRLLAQTVERTGWHLLAFCLMPNHVHLFVETTAENVGQGMHWLHWAYAKTFNQRHGRGGHLFEDRYRAPLPVATDGKFIQLVGYIAANPYKAGLVSASEDWGWSSHSLVSRGITPSWLAHARLLERLEGITGLRCYDDVVATQERLVDAERAKVPGTFRGLRQ